MPLIQIAVCDDEEGVLRRTEALLRDYDKAELEISSFLGGEALLASGRRFDVILLDIDMPGLSGLATAEQLRRKDQTVKLIYVTNYSDYTIFAFAVHAFAYLLKPLQKEALFHQLNDALLYGRKTQEEPLEFVTREGIRRVCPSEILCFEYQSRQVLLRTAGQCWHLKSKLADVAKSMAAHDFVMPHKSFVVNLYAVQSIHGYDILLSDGSRVPLSQKKSVEFRRSLNRYLAREGEEHR